MRKRRFIIDVVSGLLVILVVASVLTNAAVVDTSPGRYGEPNLADQKSERDGSNIGAQSLRLGTRPEPRDGALFFHDAKIEVAKRYGLERGADYALPQAAPGRGRKLLDTVNQTATFWCWNFATNTYYQANSTCRAAGAHAAIWVEDAVWEENGGYITQADVTALLTEIESVIYPTETLYFGEPPDVDGNGQILVLLLDIQDDFHCPGTYFIAGYFDPGNEVPEPYSNLRDMIYIDTSPLIEYRCISADFEHNVTYAYSTVVHECMHLVHWARDADEAEWVTEAGGMYAMYLCYGLNEELALDLGYFFAFHSPGLTNWNSGDIAAAESYGMGLLWLLYIADWYGGPETIGAIVNDTANGFEGFDAHLSANGTNCSALFTDFVLANYLDNISLIGSCGTPLGYTSLEIGSNDTWDLTVDGYYWTPDGILSLNWDYGPFPDPMEAWSEMDSRYPTPDRFYDDYRWSDSILPWDANYFTYVMQPNVSSFFFDFDATAGWQIAKPHSGENEWYSGEGNWEWKRLARNFTIPEGGATLQFWTWYWIEADWDYGFVEIYDYNTSTWYTLPGSTTVTTNPNPEDNSNCPRDPADYQNGTDWNGFTNTSRGWIQETMDLSSFAGHDIELAFVYWTDISVNQPGFIVDDITIPELNFSDDCETDGGWTATGMNTPWMRGDTITWNDYEVYLLGKPFTGLGDLYQVPLNSTWEYGNFELPLPDHYEELMIIALMKSSENSIVEGEYYHGADVTVTRFDAGPGSYPSAPGAFTGTITPNQTTMVTQLSTYPCPGTGGHTEYAAFSYPNGTLIAEANWSGYGNNWHIITFGKPITLMAHQTYNLTLITGSYPLIHHTKTRSVADGALKCFAYQDSNGNVHDDWIPAFRLERGEEM